MKQLSILIIYYTSRLNYKDYILYYVIIIKLFNCCKFVMENLRLNKL